MKISKKWRRMSVIYRRFAADLPFADFSDSSAIEMFCFESQGTPLSNPQTNGFSLGKKWMDVTVASWKEGIPKGLLYPFELLSDGYPEWFLIKVGILTNTMEC